MSQFFMLRDKTVAMLVVACVDFLTIHLVPLFIRVEIGRICKKNEASKMKCWKVASRRNFPGSMSLFMCPGNDCVSLDILLDVVEEVSTYDFPVRSWGYANLSVK